MQTKRLVPIFCLTPVAVAVLAAAWLGCPASPSLTALDHQTLPPPAAIAAVPPSPPAVASLPTGLPSQEDLLETIAGLRLDAEKAGIDSVVRMLARQDPGTVESILRKVPDREMSGYLLNRVAIQWAGRDPYGTAVWLLQLPAQIERSRALISVGRVWAETDPRGAADYAASFPPGPLRQQVVTAALSIWISRDLPEAGAWVAQFPPGPDFDAVAAQIARDPALIDTNAAAALNWAESISDDAGRSQGISLVLARWAERDPAAVIQYAKNTPALSDDQRSAILEHFHLGQ